MSFILGQMSLNNENLFHLISLFKDYKLSENCGSFSIFKKSENLYKISPKEDINTAVQKEDDKKNVEKKESVFVEKKQEEKALKIEKKQTKTNDDFNGEIIEKISKDLLEINDIKGVKKYLENSSFCELKNFANSTVLGDGKENAKIVLIGEAPGEEEDKNGIPFCGRSGRLLDNILLSIGLKRSDNLYITNSVFWRPPANRKPTREEILPCRVVLMKILEIISPKFVILCGGTSIESLLGMKSDKISEIRGKFSRFKEKNLDFEYTAIYHPSYLLRSPGTKKTAWIDMMSIKEVLKNL